MSKLTAIGCFFLDTCIILSDILKENTARVEKLKKDSDFYQIPCYISDSVKRESYDKVQETCNFLGNVVRNIIKYQLEESRKRRNVDLTMPITSEDIKELENLFSYFHNAVRTMRVSLPSPVALIEEWIIGFLGEMLDRGVAIDIDQFSKELVKKILDLTSSIEDLYDYLVTFERGYLKTKIVNIDPMTVAKLETSGVHNPDSVHIASVISHQTISKVKTVFVTIDFISILSKRYTIGKQFKIECCDPLYALYHLI